MSDFAKTTTLWALSAAAGFGLALALPLTEAVRLGALTGVGMSAAGGAVGLLFKRKALAQQAVGMAAVRASVKAIGLGLAVKAVFLGVGLFAAVRLGLEPLSFVCGFFGLYLVQQISEARWVLAAQARASNELLTKGGA